MDSIAAIPAPELPAALSARRRWLAAAALLAITLFAYFPALSAGYIWDDNHYITDNVSLRSIHGLEQIWFNIRTEPQYYPVTHTTFWIEYHLWKLSPLGYHLDNVLLQAAGGILLWTILRGLGVPGAWVIAAIFAIHPIQTESVAWATERKNVLSGVFFFLAAYVSLAAIDSAALQRGRAIFYPLFFSSAPLSKSVTSSLPAVILLLIWWRNGRISWRDIRPLIPFFIFGAAMGILTGWMERNVVGAIGPDFEFSRLQRCVIAGHAIWFYAAKLLWPQGLTFIYAHWNLNLTNRPWLVLFPLAAAMAVAGLWLVRRQIGRGPVVAALLFVGMLFPALGFVNVFPMRYSFVADHFQYLAGIPFVALIVGIAVQVLRRCGAMRIAGPVVTLLLIAVLCMLTHRQCRIYLNQAALWHDTITKNPSSYMAHSNYGGVLQDQGDTKDAEAEFIQSVKLKPDNISALLALGLISADRGDYQKAIEWDNLALQSVPDSLPPALRLFRFEPYYNLGVVYYRMAQAEQRSANPDKAALDADRDRAQECYLKALEYRPDFDLALENLGMLLDWKGEHDEAVKYFRRAIAADPDSSIPHVRLGDSLRATGDFAGASAEYQIAHELAAKAGEE